MGVRRSRWHTVAVVAVLLLLLALTVAFCRRDAAIRKAQAVATLHAFSQHISLQLRQEFNHVDELAAILSSGGTSAQYAQAAQAVLEDPIVLYVARMDETTLTDIYPAGGGLNQVAGAEIARLDYAYTLARLTKDLVVEGPIEQGGRRIFLTIRPILTPAADGTMAFSGAAVAALDSAAVVAALNLNQLSDSGYHYELWRVHPVDGHKERVAASAPNVDLTGGVDSKFMLPTPWTLTLRPHMGWYHLELLLLLTVASLLAAAALYIVLRLYRKNRLLEQTSVASGVLDAETGFLNRKGLLAALERWMVPPAAPFALIYIALDNYNRFSQLCAADTRSAYLKHLTLCLHQHVESAHLLARVGECNFVLAVHASLSDTELDDLQKGLAIELLWIFPLDGEQAFLTAEFAAVQYSGAGSSAATLLGTVAQQCHGHVRSQNPIHDLANLCERMARGEEGLLFGEYSDPEMNRLAKALTRLRKHINGHAGHTQVPGVEEGHDA